MIVNILELNSSRHLVQLIKNESWTASKSCIRSFEAVDCVLRGIFVEIDLGAEVSHL